MKKCDSSVYCIIYKIASVPVIPVAGKPDFVF